MCWGEWPKLGAMGGSGVVLVVHEMFVGLLVLEVDTAREISPSATSDSALRIVLSSWISILSIWVLGGRRPCCSYDLTLE